jgi:hypothetical protein
LLSLWSFLFSTRLLRTIFIPEEPMATALNTAAASAPPDTPSRAFLSDEEILGIFDESAISPAGAAPNSTSSDDFSWDSPAHESDAHSSFGRVRAPANARVAQGAVKPWGLSQPKSDAPPNTPRASANRSEIATDPLSKNVSSTGNENPDVFDSTSATKPAAPGNNATDASAPLPEWLAQISASAPNAAPELANLWERAAALDTFDRAFYGADSSAQQQLITQLYSDDPAAFRAMVSAAAQLLNGSEVPGANRNSPANQNQFVARPGFAGAGPFDATHTLPAGTPPSAHERSSTGNLHPDNTRIADGTENPRSYETGRATNSNDARQNNSAQNFNPAAYAQFEQSTNDAVVSDVSRAIDRALERALPAGIADGARRRIAGDTLAEVHTALRGDRQLAAQVAGMLRGSFDAGGSDPRAANSSGSQIAPRFDAATRDAVARLISARARGVVPEAARRVIGEWTGSVLSAHRERNARQQSASARVDVVGTQAQAPSPRRAVKSADINYRATTDEDILSW